MLRIRNNITKSDRLFCFFSAFRISSTYVILFSSYILCVSSRTSSNTFCAFENVRIFRIIHTISDPAPRYANMGTFKAFQGVLAIKAPKKAIIRIRMKV